MIIKGTLTHRKIKEAFLDMGLFNLDVTYKDGTVSICTINEVEKLKLSQIKRIEGVKFCGTFLIYEDTLCES